MIRLLQDKKVLFFDIGYTLDMPASGDWMFTGLFLREAGEPERLPWPRRNVGLRFLMENHLVASVEAECVQFRQYYSIISDELGLGLSGEQLDRAARDRAYNMDNYIPYPGIREVLEMLSKTHRLGLISDTWPSVDKQLEHIGVAQYFSFHTYSCELGVFKPDRRMYLDALAKGGVPAGETVFIDDSVPNLDGASELGITPILIAANPAADVETRHLKIHDLRELI